MRLFQSSPLLPLSLPDQQQSWLQLASEASLTAIATTRETEHAANPVAAEHWLGQRGRWQLAVGAVGDVPSRGLGLVAVAAIVLIVALALSLDTALRSTGLAASLVVDAVQVGIGASLGCL
jgi:hypothetical protein